MSREVREVVLRWGDTVVGIGRVGARETGLWLAELALDRGGREPYRGQPEARDVRVEICTVERDRLPRQTWSSWIRQGRRALVAVIATTVLHLVLWGTTFIVPRLGDDDVDVDVEEAQHALVSWRPYFSPTEVRMVSTPMLEEPLACVGEPCGWTYQGAYAPIGLKPGEWSVVSPRAELAAKAGSSTPGLAVDNWLSPPADEVSTTARPETHIVEAGETLSGIAESYGFDDYHCLYDAWVNPELVAKRPDPNRIFSGDEIVIPPVGARPGC